MRTKLRPAEFGALLMPMHEARWELLEAGLEQERTFEPERTLVLRGRLTPVTVGRTRYYLRSDVEALTGGAS